jgi:hypothetical protein
LVDKFTPEKILSHLEKIQMIEIERETRSEALTLNNFVQSFLNHMKYDKDDKEFLTVGLINLFNDVKDYELKNSYNLMPNQ